MGKKSYAALMTTVAASSLFACSGAFAQDQAGNVSGTAGATTNSGAAVGEVIVTANKRRERIQDVAMSVSALSGADLQRTQRLDLQDLIGKIPGLSLTQNGGYQTRLVLRGLNTGNSGATVAEVVDDIPFSLSGSTSQSANLATDLDTFDLNRIEVLRGPQGTLYGATAEGGLLKYVTNAPNPSAYHAGYEVNLFGLEHADTGAAGKGYVNIPLLNGTAALRASGYYEYTPGYVNDQLDGQVKTNNFTKSGARVSFLWNPTSDLSVRASAFFQTKRGDNFDTLQVNGFQNPASPFELLKGYNNDTYRLQPYRSVSQFYGLNIEYNLHWARFQSLTSYGFLHYTDATDTPVYVGIFGNLFGLPNPPTLTYFTEYGAKKYTQEFRLASEPDATLFGHRFDWQAGVFFNHEDAYGLAHYITRDISNGAVVSPLGTSEVFFTNLPSAYEEYAGYADLTYHFTPKFDIEAGGRVFNSRESFSQTLGGPLFGFPVTNQGQLTQRETSGTFSVAPRYHLTPDTLVYARVASGFRPGGPEPIVPGVTNTGALPTQFGSDRTVNYEVGLKGAAFDHKVTFDVAAFYIDWTDIQVQATYPLNGAAYPITSNVGSATSKGFEWALNWRPIHGLDIGATGAYTDATLGADLPRGADDPRTTPPTPGVLPGGTGDRLPYVPDWSSTVSVNYEWPVLGDAMAFVGGAWTHVGDQYTNFNFTAAQTHKNFPAYDTFEAQAGVRRGPFGVQLYGKNLTDERGITSYSTGQTVFGIVIPGTINIIRPRTVGLRVTADF